MTSQKKPARDHEHEDGCLCGAEPLAEHEMTQDHDLPAATGGVAGERKRRKGTRTGVEGEA